MIRFSLVCGAEHGFEGWFRDGVTFERQASGGHVGCPICGDTNVRKAVMAPAIARGSKSTASRPAPAEAADHVKAAAAMQMLRKLREHVETHFDHVGDRFAEEARRIHYGESEKRDIWGQATAAEARELDAEGIEVRPLPEPPKADG